MLMNDLESDWKNDDPLDSGLVDGSDLIYSEHTAQRREEIKEILSLMESKLHSDKHDATLDTNFFARKKQLEDELNNLYF